MKLVDLRFDEDYIYATDENGRVLRQSLLWYPRLKSASDDLRGKYTTGFDGFHWRDLDEDVSFESFEYPDAEPSLLQHFFLTHKEINVAEFAKRIGINSTLLRNYINGFKTPSKKRENEILESIRILGREYIALDKNPK